MSKKLTSDELKEQAKKLLQRAKAKEQEENAKLGEYLKSVAMGGFQATYDELKEKTMSILGLDNLSTNDAQPKPNRDNKSHDNA